MFLMVFGSTAKLHGSEFLENVVLVKLNSLSDLAQGLLIVVDPVSQLGEVLLHLVRNTGGQLLNLLGQILVLLLHEVLDSLDKSKELVAFFFLINSLHLEDQDLVVRDQAKVLEHLEVLLVQRGSVNVHNLFLLSDDVVVNLRNNGNQEVKKHDQAHELVHEPDNPDQEDDDCLIGSVFGGLVSELRVPALVAWYGDVTDGVSVGHHEVLKNRRQIVVLLVALFNLNSEVVVQNSEEDHPQYQEPDERAN